MTFPKIDFKSPLWARSGHTQTIIAHLLGHSSQLEYERMRIDTPDGDFLDIDYKGVPNKSIALLLHGLEGSSNRYYMVDLAQTLLQHGIGVLALNFRTCSGEINRTWKFYHSGETEDLDFVVNWIHKTWKPEQLFLAGFSMGGNIALKWLGEQQENANITAASAISVPYDLSLSADYIEQGLSKLYKARFIRMLNDKLNAKRALFPDTPAFTGSSLREFDNQVTAPLYGFADAEDYYTQCSSAQYIPKVKRPALLIHSKRDPFCPASSLPVKTVKKNPNLSTILTKHGGHVGYFGNPKNWLNEQIATYFNAFR